MTEETEAIAEDMMKPFAIHHGNHTFYGLYDQRTAIMIKYSDLPCPECSKPLTMEDTQEVELPPNHPMAKQLNKLKDDDPAPSFLLFLFGTILGVIFGFIVGVNL